jgi:hypothetical protein
VVKRWTELEQYLNEALGNVAAPPSAAVPAAMQQRSASDYAIEHAEYMVVVGAEQLLASIEALSAAELKMEESQADDDGTVADARDTVWEHVRGLRSDIYEFRKRRDRLSSVPCAPQEGAAGVALPREPEPKGGA